MYYANTARTCDGGITASVWEREIRDKEIGKERKKDSGKERKKENGEKERKRTGKRERETSR